MIAWSIATGILAVGVADDLKTRKIHNPLVVGLAAIALISTFTLRGLDGLLAGVIACAVALGLTVPLVLAKALGGGDMKLLAAFGLATDWNAVFWVFAFSLVWGALLGVVRAIISGQFKNLVFATVNIALRKTHEGSELHRIPYSIALLLGWFTHSVIAKLGVWA